MYKNFFKIVLGAISGSILGTISGFLLAIIINLLIMLSVIIFNANPGVPPTSIVAFLSIGIGGVIGGICGVVFMFKKI